MSPAVTKRLALAAFILMVLTLVWTLVRPRIPGSPVSRAELIGIPIQIVLATSVDTQIPQLIDTSNPAIN